MDVIEKYGLACRSGVLPFVLLIVLVGLSPATVLLPQTSISGLSVSPLFGAYGSLDASPKDVFAVMVVVELESARALSDLATPKLQLLAARARVLQQSRSTKADSRSRR